MAGCENLFRKAAVGTAGDVSRLWLCAGLKPQLGTKQIVFQDMEVMF